MSVAVDLSEFEVPRRACRVGQIILELSPEQLAKFEAALAREDISTSRITKVLDAWGHHTTPNTVQTHRAKLCGCG